jgi:hypothetical protein
VQLQREQRIVADREGREVRNIGDIRGRRLLDPEPVRQITEDVLAQPRALCGQLDLDDAHRAAQTAAATCSTSASESVRQSRSVLPSRTTAITGGCRVEAVRQRLLHRIMPRSAAPPAEAHAADTGDRLLDLAADELGETFGPGAHELDRLVQHSQHGNGVACGWVERQRERPLESSERELVRAQRALQWVPAQPLDEVARPTTIPACGRRAACRRRSRRGRRLREGFRRSRLVADPASAPEPRSSTSGSSCRRAIAASSASCGRSVKPTTRKFDWCDAQEHAVSGPIACS